MHGQFWSLVSLALFMIAISMISAALKAKRSGKLDLSGQWPYALKGDFMNGSETKLFLHLRQSLPDFHIFPQVAVSQLLTVTTDAQRRAWFSKIDRLVVDFVICDVSLKPVGVIECDGPSHRANKQQARDFKKDKAFEVAGLKVVRIAAGKLPDATELQGRFRSASAV